MKILFATSFLNATGADRWTCQGYKYAFEDMGHKFFVVTETDNFKKAFYKINPDIFMISFSAILRRIKKGEIDENFLSRIKKSPTKMFVDLGLDYLDEPNYLKLLGKYENYFDIFYSYFDPESIKENFKIITKPFYLIPCAADKKHFYPDKAVQKFVCDIAFVGSYFTKKQHVFKKLLFPLMEKYDVKLFGTGWTKKDKFLRILGAAGRRLHFKWLRDSANKNRVTISQDDERRLYASAKICINIHEYYPNGKTMGLSNEREFKVPASGGFQLSDYVPTMYKFYEIGKEIVMAKDEKDWFKKIEYYLNHPDERNKIKKAGIKRALRDHTYHNRARKIISIYKKNKQE